MAGDAPRLHLGSLEQLWFPKLGVTVRQGHRVNRRTLPLVAGRPSKLVGRMLEDDLDVIGMGAERFGSAFEAALILGHVTALTAIHPRHRLVEGIAIEVVDRGLVNLWNLGIAE